MTRESRIHLHRTWERVVRKERWERRKWQALMAILFLAFLVAAVYAAMGKL